MSSRQLARHFRLTDFQSYVRKIVYEQGFDNSKEAGNITKRFMLLSEEVGELAKAACGTLGMKFTADYNGKDSTVVEAANIQIARTDIRTICAQDRSGSSHPRQAINQ